MKFIFAALVALALAGCQTTGMGGEPTVDHPGTKVTIKNPDPQKWVGKRIVKADIPFWICKPLACAEPSVVLAKLTRSPTRSPDPEALKKVAKLIPAKIVGQNAMMEAVTDGQKQVHTLSSKTLRLRGYPAVMVETRRDDNGQASYSIDAHIFIGLSHTELLSTSKSLNVARKNFRDFLDALEIIDIPPAG